MRNLGRQNLAQSKEVYVLIYKKSEVPKLGTYPCQHSNIEDMLASKVALCISLPHVHGGKGLMDMSMPEYLASYSLRNKPFSY